MRKCLLVLIIASVCISNSFSQNPTQTSFEPETIKPIARQILNAQSGNADFQTYNLFRMLDDKKLINTYKATVDSFALLDISTQTINKLLSEKPQYLKLNIPSYNGNDLELLLIQHNVAAEGFVVTTASGRTILPDNINGLHYWGMIKGHTGSSVAISIFENEVMGMISDGYGNIVLGKLDNNPQHILYNDISLKIRNQFECATQQDEDIDVPKFRGDIQTEKCVKLYWEINYDIFKSKGSVLNATNFAMGIFNQSQLLYANDFISVSLSQLKIWDIASPYSGVESFDWLNSFQDNLGSFNGDLGHLITYSNSTGGVAAKIYGLCSGNWKNKKCFSGINNTVNNVPTYSWTIGVISHEQGHLMGSPHTHACVWNGDKSAIDGCGPQAGYGYEGDCSNAPIPSKGTVMSYCHLTNTGIDFKLGFGAQPAALIISRINAASCLVACPPCTPGTPNDNCSAQNGPQNLNIYSSCKYVNGTTCGATASITTGNSCSISGLNANTLDVWYSFVATCTDQVIKVQGGTNFDAVVELFNTPCDTQSTICKNDFTAGKLETLNANGLIKGNTYYIRIYDRSEGQFKGLTGGNEFEICVSSNTCFPNLVVDNNSGVNKLINNVSEIDLTLDIVNNGNTNSGNGSTIYYYLSSDSTVNTSDYLIASDLISNLSEGEHIIKNIAVNICNLDLTIPNGNYFIGYIIDQNNEVTEADENDNSGIYDFTQVVVVNCCVTNSAPAALKSNSPHCNTVTITREGIPAPGTVWYWQGNTCGKIKTLGTDSTLIVNTGGTYYLRAFDTIANCWSAACTSIEAVIGGVPATPVITLSNSPQCGVVNILRKYTVPANVLWYWQGTSCGSSTDLGTDTVFLAKTSGEYFLRAYNTASECWSTECESVEVEVKPLPKDPAPPTSNSPQCDKVIITRAGAPTSNVIWYWQGNSCGTSQNLGSGATFTANSSDNYYLRAFDNIGKCWSELCAETNVTIAPDPVLNPLKIENKYIIITPLEPGDKVQWFYNGSPITEINDSLLCLGSGVYNCIVTNAAGCSTSSDILSINSCTVATKDLDDENQINVFPNPTSKLLTIQGNSFKNGEVDLILFNSLGQRLFSTSINITAKTLDTQLDLSEFSSGVYYIMLGNESFRKVFKVEKM